MNLHPRHSRYDTVACSGSRPRGNKQSCVRHQVCFGMRGVVLCKSRDAEQVEDAGGVLNTGGKGNRDEDRNKGYIYSSSCDVIHLLHFVG
jgi:hypothetical protein